MNGGAKIQANMLHENFSYGINGYDDHDNNNNNNNNNNLKAILIIKIPFN
jgi:hypothetical protein